MPKNTQCGFIQFLLIFLGLAILLGGTAGLYYYRTAKVKDINPFKKPITKQVTPIESSESALTEEDLFDETLEEEDIISDDPYDNCGSKCQAIIDKKMAQYKKDILTALNAEITKINSTQPTAVFTSQNTTTSTTSSPKEAYISFGVTGTSQSTSWVPVTGSSITFNKDNYPGAKAFYFQASLQSDAPDRAAYGRIFNTTSGTDIPNSEIAFTGLTATHVESNAINLPSGNITLYVQIKSQLGNYATIYNPRIKAVY